MKYIKDRFYNSRKRNSSLGAPDQDLFTREERSAFSCGLWVQRYNKFLKPPNIRRSFFSRALSELKTRQKLWSYWRREPPKPPAVHLSRNCVRHLWPVGSPSSLGHPSLLSCECKGTTTFWIHQIFGEVFFREPRSCVLHLLYIVSYPLGPATSTKEAFQRRSNRQNLLTTQGSPDTSEGPFFWVASAKVIHLPQSTKLSANFFSPKATPRKHNTRKQGC